MVRARHVDRAGDNSARGEGRSQHDADAVVAIDAFRRILRELRVLARKSELATGLSAAQLFVLSVLVERPGASLTQIAESTMTDRTSVAAVLDRLVEQGFVVREQAADDRRRAAVTITPAGRRAMRRATPPPTAVLLDGMRQLTSTQRRVLATGLSALTRAMGLQEGPAGMLFEDPPARQRRGR